MGFICEFHKQFFFTHFDENHKFFHKYCFQYCFISRNFPFLFTKTARAALLTGRLPIRNGFYTTNAHARNGKCHGGLRIQKWISVSVTYPKI